MGPEKVFALLTLWPLRIALLALCVFLFLVYKMQAKHAQWSRFDKPRRVPRTRLGRRFRCSRLGLYLLEPDSDRTRYWFSLTVSWTLSWACLLYSMVFMYDWAVEFDSLTTANQDDNKVITLLTILVPCVCAFYLLLGGIWFEIIHHKFWARVRATIAMMVVWFSIPIVIFMAT